MIKHASSPAGETVLKYKIHWHVLLTHFPVSFFMLSFVFMLLHMLTRSTCFELAASISLLAGMIILLPSAVSGWLTWKNRYKGTPARIFIYKIRIALSMIVLSVVLVSFRALMPGSLHEIWMWVYPAGLMLLLLGSMAEGYFGGRLNHR